MLERSGTSVVGIEIRMSSAVAKKTGLMLNQGRLGSVVVGTEMSVSRRLREDRFDVGPLLDEFDHVGEFPLARDARVRQPPKCGALGCSWITT